MCPLYPEMCLQVSIAALKVLEEEGLAERSSTLGEILRGELSLLPKEVVRQVREAMTSTLKHCHDKIVTSL